MTGSLTRWIGASWHLLQKYRDKPEEGIAHCDQLIDQAETSRDAENSRGHSDAIREARRIMGLLGRESDILEEALFTKAALLLISKRKNEANAIYHRLLERFGNARIPALLERAKAVIFERINFLVESGNEEDAIAACDSVIAEFKSEREIELREIVAEALHNKGIILGSLGRVAERNAVDKWLVTEFGKASEPELRKFGMWPRLRAKKGATPSGRANLNWMNYDQLTPPREGRKEGIVPDEQDTIAAEEGVRAFFHARGVPDEQMDEAIAEAERLVVRAKIKRVPIWDERPDNVRYLTAPNYLRTMYSFLFGDKGRIEHEDLVREHDPELIRLIQQYISQRTRRGADDLGDAEGLVFERKDARGRPPNKRLAGSRKRAAPRPR